MMRPAEITDFDAVYEIYMEPSINLFMNFEVISKTEFKPIFDEFRTFPSSLFVFEEKNEVVGACAVVKKQRRQSHVAYLGSLAIGSKCQGLGLGKRYISSLIEDLRKEGFKRIELIVEADNPKAIRFYESLGFQREGVMRKFLKRKSENSFVDDIYMAVLFD